MTTRRYTQQARAEAADETRRRILDAMRERLRAAPSEALSIERVAQEAGVARSTVYVVFGSKAASSRRSARTCSIARVSSASSTPSRCPTRAKRCASPSARPRACTPPSATSAGRSTRWGRSSLRRCAARSRSSSAAAPRGNADWPSGSPQEGHLRPDVTVEEAADILWVITSFETFDQLYTGRALGEEDTAARLITMAERTLWIRHD